MTFRAGPTPKIFPAARVCKPVLGKVLKSRIVLNEKTVEGGEAIPTFSAGRLYQVSINGGPSYLVRGRKIIRAPAGGVFIEALLPLIIKRLYPLPRGCEVFRVARVLYRKLHTILPPRLKNTFDQLYRRRSWRHLDNGQLRLIETSGGTPIFIPIHAQPEIARRRYEECGLSRELGYALRKASASTEHWHDRLSTIGSTRGLHVDASDLYSLLFRLTAPLDDPEVIDLPNGAYAELIDSVLARQDEWLPEIKRETLLNISSLYV